MTVNLSPRTLVVGFIFGLAIAATVASGQPPSQPLGRYQLTVSEGPQWTRTYITDTETGRVGERDEPVGSSSYYNGIEDELFAAGGK
jgi:hypothetical protein